MAGVCVCVNLVPLQQYDFKVESRSHSAELFDLLANQGASSSKASAMDQTSALIQLLVGKDLEIQVLKHK